MLTALKKPGHFLCHCNCNDNQVQLTKHSKLWGVFPKTKTCNRFVCNGDNIIDNDHHHAFQPPFIEERPKQEWTMQTFNPSKVLQSRNTSTTHQTEATKTPCKVASGKGRKSWKSCSKHVS
eukprot:6349237-Amphidinium_carterae.1